MKFPLFANFTTGCYLIGLLLGCGLTGWLLAAFQVHWLVCLISLVVMAHLIIVGVDAIALANVWVLIIMLAAAVVKAWPAVWNSHVPMENARLWAGGLLLLWMGAIAQIMLLAFARPFVRSKGLGTSHALRGTVILSWTASVLGYLMYDAIS